MRALDRALALVLGLGAGIGHTLGSLAAYGSGTDTLLWSLDAGAFGATLGALHLLRSFRPADRVLAWLVILPTVAWIASCLRFGALLHDVADPRVVMFVAASAGLIGFSLRTALRQSPAPRFA